MLFAFDVIVWKKLFLAASRTFHTKHIHELRGARGSRNTAMLQNTWIIVSLLATVDSVFVFFFWSLLSFIWFQRNKSAHHSSSVLLLLMRLPVSVCSCYSCNFSPSVSSSTLQLIFLDRIFIISLYFRWYDVVNTTSMCVCVCVYALCVCAWHKRSPRFIWLNAPIEIAKYCWFWYVNGTQQQGILVFFQ